MSRLPRPPIRYSIRLQVITRQLTERGIAIPERWHIPCNETLVDYVNRLRRAAFGDRANDLHHRPALVNRRWIPGKPATLRRAEIKGDYDPPANDPAHLHYLLKVEEHDIETRVRGLHGQHSDLGLARKNKRIARNRDPRRHKVKIRSANRWPPKGHRKISNRSTR